MKPEAIIKKIDRYCEEARLAPSTVCLYAGVSPRFYANLSSGGRFYMQTADKLFAWMKENPPKVKVKRK